MRAVLIWASVLLALPLTATAVPIVNVAPCVAPSSQCFTGIQNLSVGGDLYDVTWIDNTYANVLASHSGVATFVGNQGLALEAAQAITAAFRATGLFLATFNAPLGNGTGGWGVTDVVYGQSAGGNVSTYMAWSSLNLSPVALTRTATAPYAVFSKLSVVSVPEPATLSLLGLGLAGLGFMRRRKAA